MNILFIGHGYHRKTGSSAFFRRLLEGLGKVEDIADQAYLPGTPRTDYRAIASGAHYDLVVVWQIEYAARQLAGLDNAVFVPMFDSCRGLPASFWSGLRGMRVLAFSRAVYERAQTGGCRAAYCQFWPEPPATGSGLPQDPHRAFHWYRRNEITPSRVAWLATQLGIAELVVHWHPDPTEPRPLTREAFADRVGLPVRFTDWSNDRSALFAELAMARWYIASRSHEGIGMAFLEAMAHGCAVVAPRNPTYTDYIVSGTNGLLYDEDRLDLPPAADLAGLGAAAAQRVRIGAAQWRAGQQALLAWLRGGPKPEAVPVASLPAGSFGPAGPGVAATLVTVVTVVRNAPGELRETIESVLSQRGVLFDYVVFDGDSTDDTLAVARSFGGRITKLVSERDAGVYDAMNRSLQHARGEYVLYMNAGDCFVDDTALKRLMEGAGADIIAGHHIYDRVDGTEALHRAARPDLAFRALVAGQFSDAWEHGMPGHQATATRTRLLQHLGYDTRYRIAADRDLLLRAMAEGATCHVADTYVARYRQGGLSTSRAYECALEWQEMALAHCRSPVAVRHFYAIRILDAFVTRLAGLPSFGGRVSFVWRERGAWFPALLRADRRIVGDYLRQVAARQVRRLLPARYRLVIDLRARRSSGGAALEGFSFAEPHGTWTERPQAVVALGSALPDVRRIRLEFPALRPQLDGASVALTANDGDPVYIVLRKGVVTIDLPDPTPIERLRLALPPCLSPRDLGQSDDERPLGVMIRRITLE